METLEELRDRLLREERVQKMVRMRAYEIYKMRGAQPGWESHDWFQAESEVLAFLIAMETRLEDEKIAADTLSDVSAPAERSIYEAPEITEATPVIAEAVPPIAGEAGGFNDAAPRKVAAGKKTKPRSTAKSTPAKPAKKASPKPATPAKSGTPTIKRPRKPLKTEDQ